MFYRVTYRIDAYIVADAFRPNPGWGTKVFSCEYDSLPPHTDAEMIKAAKDDSPSGYWLQRLDLIGSEPHIRQIYCEQVPFSKAA